MLPFLNPGKLAKTIIETRDSKTAECTDIENPNVPEPQQAPVEEGSPEYDQLAEQLMAAMAGKDLATLSKLIQKIMRAK